LGRLVRRKGCLELLKAFGLLTSLVPEVRLTIAGDGPQRASLERYAREHGLGEKVEFSGFIKEADKPELLAGADIACFPSLYGESFGIVLIEAMAAGSGVVIGGDNPGYRSVLGEHEILLIDPTDSQSFASRLAELLQDKVLAARLHKWQSGQIKKYDVATVGPKLESVYRQAIAKRAETRHN
jgi:phosphatidylinositol alpha-mannosyltransferase